MRQAHDHSVIPFKWHTNTRTLTKSPLTLMLMRAGKSYGIIDKRTTTQTTKSDQVQFGWLEIIFVWVRNRKARRHILCTLWTNVQVVAVLLKFEYIFMWKIILRIRILCSGLCRWFHRNFCHITTPCTYKMPNTPHPILCHYIQACTGTHRIRTPQCSVDWCWNAPRAQWCGWLHL